MKVKNDHHSKFSNLSNWKEEAWKNQGFNGIRTRDLRDTGAMLYQLSYEATHRYRGGHGFESRWSPDFFQASSFQLLKLENLLWWSFFTFIYNRSSNMNYFIYSSKQKLVKNPNWWRQTSWLYTGTQHTGVECGTTENKSWISGRVGSYADTF